MRLLPFLALPLLAAVAAHAASPSPLDPRTSPVRTESGKVQGILLTDSQVRAYKGIPYAAPPTGTRRWQAPQPPAKWIGTLHAEEYGNHCVQTNPFADMHFDDVGASEDCLTLNIWSPAKIARGKSLPVMVWIHGGGFTAGGASEPRHDGQYLAHHNVVVVTLNYRLGILGFFAHPALTAESPHHASGNYGLLDQAAAIAWVKRNIAEFGGDPKNITLFGESAGSFSVAAQMASPLSKDLLAKGIGESGAPFADTLPYAPLAQAETAGAAFAQSSLGTNNLAELRKLSVDDLIRASAAKGAPRFSPDIDGYFLPAPVPEIYAAGQQAHIPLLGGWNADEGRATALNAKPPITAASFAAQATTLYADQAPSFLAAYPATTDAEALTSAGDLAGDKFIAFSTWRWLEAHVKTGAAPTYRYFFTLPAPPDKFHGSIPAAFHSDDIEYVFGTLDSRIGAHWRPEDRALSDQIQQYWTNFARTGDPNAPGLPQWPTYAPTQWSVMTLSAESKAAPDARRARYLFLDAHPPKP